MHIRGYKGIRATTVDVDGCKKEAVNPLSYLPNYF
jgi:hypothetical protein